MRLNYNVSIASDDLFKLINPETEFVNRSRIVTESE